MRCPYCGNSQVFYAASSNLHYMRLLLNSPKRYCPSCDKKWLAKHSGHRFSWQLGAALALISIVSVFFVEEMGTRSFQSQREASLAAHSQEASLMQQVQGHHGEDTSLLTKLTPAQIKQAGGAGVNPASTKLPFKIASEDMSLFQKAQQKFKQDPNFLSKLTPAQRKHAEKKAKEYGFSLPG